MFRHFTSSIYGPIPSLLWHRNGESKKRSEPEVEELIIKNLRPLHVIEVSARCPFPRKNYRKNGKDTKLSLCTTNRSRDGYVEILPGRFPILYIKKRRVDAATQTSDEKKSAYAQTTQNAPRNRAVQYQSTYDKVKITEENFDKISNFLDNSLDTISNEIEMNYFIKLFIDDYETLPNRYVTENMSLPVEIASYRDVITCKGKRVSCLSYNSFISGILVAAYSTNPSTCIRKCDIDYDEVYETQFNPSIILLWDYSDPIVPKFYLHAPREITSLSFCPYDENILVGGCKNGQIVIWDITGVLAKIEHKESVHVTDLQVRETIKLLTSWMKQDKDDQHVYPAAISSLENSQTDSVTGIKWLKHGTFITRNGILTSNEDEEVLHGNHMQFFASSLDSTVCVWDIDYNNFLRLHPTVRQKRKLQRLSKLPLKLTLGISPYKILNNRLVPVYKLKIINKETSEWFPCLNIVVPEMIYYNKYEAVNTETVNNSYKRTYFQFVPSAVDSSQLKQTFNINTGLGRILTCSWTGNKYDQGFKVNSEFCKIYDQGIYHDGPVRLARVNPFDNEIILSIGGRVFAIWNSKLPGVPILWRKCATRYVNGMWLDLRPATIIMARTDCKCELWNLLEDSKCPIRTISYTGGQIIDLYSNSKKNHINKGTFVTLDTMGNLKIHSISSDVLEVTENQKNEVKYVTDRFATMKLQLKDWIEQWKKVHSKQDILQSTDMSKMEQKHSLPTKSSNLLQSSIAALNEDKIDLRRKLSLYTIKHNEWQERQENIFRKIMLEKKKLNMAELELRRKPLEKMLNEKHAKLKKIEEIMKQKQKIFDAAKLNIYPKYEIRSTKRYTVSFSPEIKPFLKRTYIKDFNKINIKAMNYVKNHQYRFIFDWNMMITVAKDRLRNAILAEHGNANQRKARRKSMRIFSIIGYDPSNLQDLHPGDINAYGSRFER